jgi:hypothetical protein
MSREQIAKEMQEIYQQKKQNSNEEQESQEEWIQSILEKTEQYHYLEGKTKTDLQQDIEMILNQNIFLSNNERETFSKRLKEYRYIDEIPDFIVGRHIRWIQNPNSASFSPDKKPVLTNGGILTDIKFRDNGVYLLCKMYDGSRKKTMFHQYKLEDYHSFQKITPEEWIILMANECSVSRP